MLGTKVLLDGQTDKGTTTQRRVQVPAPETNSILEFLKRIGAHEAEGASLCTFLRLGAGVSQKEPASRLPDIPEGLRWEMGSRMWHFQGMNLGIHNVPVGYLSVFVSLLE